VQFLSNTIFNKIDYNLSSLMEDIASGELGLPEIQRLFVWKNVRIRDLFDSMYRGYPIGYLLFWDTGARPGARQIGAESKQRVPKRVIVDGQQRLTSLYAVIRGVPVLRDNYVSEKIEIAFNPLTGRFEVPDAAVKRDKRFIRDISAIWDSGTNLIQFAGDYIEGLKSLPDGVEPNDIARAQTALGRLHSLLHFPFTVLELAAQADADQVAEVFVRINSEGKKLNQSDFILTLMSVFWDAGRTQLEDFSRQARIPSAGSVASPFNHYFQPDADQLLRVAIAVGFHRARLSAVYAVLRGRNVSNESTEAANRDEQFEKLKAGQAAALNLQTWHDFLHCVVLAGYRSPKIISSENALIFAYSLYIIGRTQVGVDEHILRKKIAQWLFMSSLTARFATSPESKMEFDLARLRGVSTQEAFVAAIDEICAASLTGDFWTTTLPSDLATSAGRSPSMFAFFAALNVLDARALYSPHTVRELMDPAMRGTRSTLERHHLFPVAYLKRQGVADKRDYNQIANYAIVEWGDNSVIADADPTNYVPEFERRFDSDTLKAMYRHHALPAGWQELSFDKFARERRNMMAQTIREAYEKLVGHDSNVTPRALDVASVIESGESSATEFKSTLRTNLHTGERDGRIELAALKTIAGFLNTTGGTLFVGVSDDGTPVGVGADGFADEDKMALHLINLLKDRIGGQHALNIHPRFDDYPASGDHAGERVLAIECDPSRTPVFVKDGPVERFFVRYGPSTQELGGETAQAYMRQRFG
jgi:hypothetical protein